MASGPAGVAIDLSIAAPVVFSRNALPVDARLSPGKPNTETSVPAGPSAAFSTPAAPVGVKANAPAAAVSWTPAFSPRRTVALATITWTPAAGPNSLSTNDPLTTSPPVVSEPSNV